MCRETTFVSFIGWSPVKCGWEGPSRSWFLMVFFDTETDTETAFFPKVAPEKTEVEVGTHQFVQDSHLLDQKCI
jgi:hypothetical protein